MRIGRAGLVAGTLALLTNPAMAKDEFPNDVAAHEKAVKLEPFSPWNIDYGENRCRLARLFGGENERHALFFEQGSPAPSFTMTIGGPEMKRWIRRGPISLGMERDEAMVRYDRVASAELGEFGPAIILTGKNIDDQLDLQSHETDEPKPREQRELRHIDLAEAATIDRIVLQRGRRVVSLETGNMKAPFQALNQCTKSLLTIWGLDADQHDTFTPVRWTNARAVAKRIQGRYPSQALRKGEQGIFRLRVIVEADGNMSECHINNATLTDSLQSPACQEMQRAIFEPALDKDGKPMRSYYMTRIIYQTG